MIYNIHKIKKSLNNKSEKISNTLDDYSDKLDDYFSNENNVHKVLSIMGLCLGTICLIGSIVNKDNNTMGLYGKIIGYSGAGVNYTSAIFNGILHKKI